MSTLAFFYILTGVILIVLSAQKMEKYSIASSLKFGVSPFLIGSTVIALGTSAPEIFTSLFAAMGGKFHMVVGNVVGSNVANIALVFGLTLFILAIKKEQMESNINPFSNVGILIISTLIVCGVILINPFSIISSSILLTSLLGVIFFWYFKNERISTNVEIVKEKFLLTKLLVSIAVLVIAAWLITKGALEVLMVLGVGELFVGYTVLAIGTSLPEIAASIALALKGRYEAVIGTLIGSNIFNGLLVLAIPGIINNKLFLPESSNNPYLNSVEKLDTNLSILLVIFLIIVTILFSLYVILISKKPRRASLSLALILLGTYFTSLFLTYN